MTSWNVMQSLLPASVEEPLVCAEGHMAHQGKEPEGVVWCECKCGTCISKTSPHHALEMWRRALGPAGQPQRPRLTEEERAAIRTASTTLLLETSHPYSAEKTRCNLRAAHEVLERMVRDE